jgi:hypothetical protein
MCKWSEHYHQWGKATTADDLNVDELNELKKKF